MHPENDTADKKKEILTSGKNETGRGATSDQEDQFIKVTGLSISVPRG